MYSCNIFKDTAALINAEPFALGDVDSLEEIMPESDQAVGIGSRIEVLEREAYENGFNAGEKAGFEFGRKKAEVLFSGINGVLNELTTFRESLFSKCEKEMVELCISVAKKVIQRETAIKEDGVLECLRGALKSVVAGGQISVRINPKDLEIVNANRTELMRFCGAVKGMSVESDEMISRGGCAISTNFGEIDATIETVMQEIEEKLTDAYRGN
jgi:flagellar assembly protein FliH